MSAGDSTDLMKLKPAGSPLITLRGLRHQFCAKCGVAAYYARAGLRRRFGGCGMERTWTCEEWSTARRVRLGRALKEREERGHIQLSAISNAVDQRSCRSQYWSSER
ncbi:hypothetical protein CERSUDRAFT_84496 [Gelatoporia subvermispora B]|uniref:Uncharacterized protein n=1 Tax=Ceriporiopsis subvermispora (strain B) TaxID=914234 RepID=M2QH63_CERS8|nr:hypothetical protein CERSUDRAFT_84496 [Gelatoporia subvermispora B]